MLTLEQRKAILALIHQQVVPAIGCTEPAAVALCVARARQLLGNMPEKVQLWLSPNILKNAMGVGIPGTNCVGLPIATALGVLIGKPEKELEVLCDCTPEAVEQAKAYIDEGRINIHLEENDPDKLYIRALVSTGDSHAQVVIKHTHTHIVEEKTWTGQEQEEKKEEKRESIGSTDHEHPTTDTQPECIAPELTMSIVYEFATTTAIDDLRFILDAKRLNEAAAADGLRENRGHQLGKTMCSPLGKGIMGDGIFAKILSKTSCACDARMSGAMVSVMTNSGSGNQGICTTMPVVVFAEENHNTEEELIRALILSNLTAIYIKQHLGTLSALCGCVVASTGSSVGITLLMGGNYEQICFSVKNMIANLTGMICDGAKPSCSLKLTTGVGTAVMSAMMAMQHKYVSSLEGIIDDDVDQSIRNLVAIGGRGMDATDKTVLNIMTSKGNQGGY